MTVLMDDWLALLTPLTGRSLRSSELLQPLVVVLSSGAWLGRHKVTSPGFPLSTVELSSGAN